MSKEVYSIENQEKFNVAMIVGHVTSLVNGTKHEKLVENWTFDMELTALSMAVYDIVNGKNYSNDEICAIVDELLSTGFDPKDRCNAITENMQKEVEYVEDREDYQDFWYGVECGSYFGLPEKSTLEKCDKVMRIFMDNMRYGFVHEVIMDMED